MSSITGMPAAVMLQFQDDVYRTEYHLTWLTISLQQMGFKDTVSADIAGKLLCTWFDALSRETTDDENGIPLTVEMLPFSTNSTLIIMEALGNRFNGLDVAKIVVAWNQLRGQLLDEVSTLYEEVPLQEFIELSTSMYLVPDNDIELSSLLPFRMFSSKAAARAYEDKDV